MANKTLILGAALANKYKSYNISESITPAVDKALKGFNSIVLMNEQRKQAYNKVVSNVTAQVDKYLSELDENPDLELLPDPIKDLYYKELNTAKSDLGKLLIKKNSPEGQVTYAVGTDGYAEITGQINEQKKYIEKLYKDANKFQQINANWFNEHGNISETWKQMNLNKYMAMSHILNFENPNYTVELDENKDWIISTTIPNYESNAGFVLDKSSPVGVRVAPSNMEISLSLDDLDWDQLSVPELITINDSMQAGIDKALKGFKINAAEKIQMQLGFQEMIGQDEGKLYSLMFDDLPIGQGKQPLFTDQDFADDYPDFDRNNPDTWHDFDKMKELTIARLITKIEDENERIRLDGLQYHKEPDITQAEATRRVNVMSLSVSFENFMKNLDKNLSAKQIAEQIANKSDFQGSLNLPKTKGFTFYPNKASIGEAVANKFNIEEEIKEYQKEGNILPLLKALLVNTSNSKGRAAVSTDIRGFIKYTDKQKAEFAGDIL